MNLSDILTLAKQGFKASDIKELIALADSKDSGTDTETEKTDDTEKESGKDTGTEQTDGKEDPEPDYKSLYEDSQKALKAAQAENRKKNSGKDEKTPKDVALEHFNKILKG